MPERKLRRTLNVEVALIHCEDSSCVDFDSLQPDKKAEFADLLNYTALSQLGEVIIIDKNTLVQ